MRFGFAGSLGPSGLLQILLGVLPCEYPQKTAKNIPMFDEKDCQAVEEGQATTMRGMRGH